MLPEFRVDLWGKTAWDRTSVIVSPPYLHMNICTLDRVLLLSSLEVH